MNRRISRAGGNSVWLGAPGALAVAERLSPDAARRDRLAEMVAASLDSPALEPMYGHPGHMVLAAQLHARTGEARWAELWSAGAERLLETWRHDESLGAWLWTQRLAGHDARFVGPAHGLVGNVHALLRGEELLAPKRRVEVEQRAVESLMRLAVVENGHANWPPVADDPLEHNGPDPRAVVPRRPRRPNRRRGCGARRRGVECADGGCRATGVGRRAAYETTRGCATAPRATRTRSWRSGAGPATSGGWRGRGRSPSTRRGRSRRAPPASGHGRHSLFTGDEGVALCLASCLTGDARLPIADRLL